MSPPVYTPPRTRHALVVVESGSDRLAWRRALAAAGVTAEMVVQRPGEAPASHAARAIQELGSDVSTLILVAGPRTDASTLDARSVLLRAFADATVESGVARTIQLEGGGVARFAMEALSEMASAQLRTSGIEVIGPRGEPERRAA